MAILRKHELKQMPAKQMEERLSELKKELMKVRTQLATGRTPDNPGKIKEIKRTIARMLTISKNKKQEANLETKKQ